MLAIAVVDEDDCMNREEIWVVGPVTDPDLPPP